MGKRAPVDLVADVRLGKCRPAWLAPKSPRFFKQSYEPLFFDARLPFSEEIEKGAGAALGIATTGVERAVAVVAGGGRGEFELERFRAKWIPVRIAIKPAQIA